MKENISNIFSIPIVISGIISFYLMKKIRDTIVENQIDETGLKGKNFLFVFILCMFAPFVSSTIFYYGWKKMLPKKAKQANTIGWISIIIVFLIGFSLM